ncbi:NAD(P)-binding protein [Thozetella sp. PMI_491]|nr:NAD(P)-binding protein [Thozetella sp. PMI_491]
MHDTTADFLPDRDIPDLSGQVIIVTGGSTGLGLETIRQLAKHNPSRIYLAARSRQKSEAAIKQLKASNKAATVSFLNLDLSSFASIQTAAKEFMAAESRLDILINNAGIMMAAEDLTKDGYEIQFGTNHLGPALFTQLLLPALQHTAKINPQTRVVNLSSGAEAMAPEDIYKFDEFKTTMAGRKTSARYCISKIANVHYNSANSRRYPDVKFVCVHPGIVATDLRHSASGFFVKLFLNTANLFAVSVEKGALGPQWAAVSEDAKTGVFYSPIGVPDKNSSLSRNRELQEALWSWTQEQFKAYL